MVLGNPHNIVDSHEGELSDAQIAGGTPTSGQVPISDGDGTRTWGDMESGGGGLADLITGDSQTFDASLGDWTNTGGTLTRDTTYKMVGATASLKFAVTTSGHRVDLPIAGTFLDDTDYWLVLFISNESTSSTFSVGLSFGLVGTDATTQTLALNMATGKPYVGDGNFIAVGIRWRPTADRTGVTARLSANFSSSTTWHIGMARAWQTPIIAPVRVNSEVYDPTNLADHTFSIRPWASTVASGINIYPNVGDVEIANYQETSYISLSDTYFYIYAVHTAADLPQEGINVQVGEDFIGFFISQKDADTVQFYGDFDDYNFEFEDGATNGWASVSGSGVTKRFSTMENRVNSGSATITSGNTSIAVTHGAGYTPAAADIRVLPTNNPDNDPGNFWVSSIGATQFTINVRSDPGASGAIFTWVVDR